MTAKAAASLPDELLALTRRLRLPYLRAHAPEVIATAKAQRWDPAEVLRVLLDEEAKGRDRATRELRRRQAQFPSGKTFESWREQDSSIPVATQRALMTLEWISRAECLSISGPSASSVSSSSCRTETLSATGRASWSFGDHVPFPELRRAPSSPLRVLESVGAWGLHPRLRAASPTRLDFRSRVVPRHGLWRPLFREYGWSIQRVAGRFVGTRSSGVPLLAGVTARSAFFLFRRVDRIIGTHTHPPPFNANHGRIEEGWMDEPGLHEDLLDPDRRPSTPR